MTTAVEDYLEHSGVKGMKWGVTRAKNRMATNTIKRNANAAHKDIKYYKKVETLEKAADRVTGDGTSKVNRGKGDALHNLAMRGRYKKAADIDNRYNSNHSSVTRSIERNARVASKLQQKVNKASGAKKAKAQANLKAWNAYSKIHNKKMGSQVSRYNKNSSAAHAHHVNGLNADNARTERAYAAKHPNSSKMTDKQMDTAMRKELKRQGMV